MKKSLIIFLTLIASISLNAQDIITSEAISRTFFIKIGNETGTAFIGIYSGKSYLITAKHLFIGSPKNPVISIFLKNEWAPIIGRIYFHVNPNVDVAVISTPSTDGNKDFIQLYSDADTTINFTFGDTGFFLGFPYGFYTEDNSHINQDHPFPLVKRAGFSGQMTVQGIEYVLLDGLNNPGFSGGPIFFKNRKDPNDKIWHLLGVINGYINQNDSTEFKFKDSISIIKYVENSGIIYATPTRYITQIIEQIK